MPSRINHVKLVSPHPELINAFLTQVCDIPEGWPLGAGKAVGPDVPLGPGGDLPMEAIGARRQTSMEAIGAQRQSSEETGFIAGDSTSRQVQIFGGPTAFLGHLHLVPLYRRCLRAGQGPRRSMYTNDGGRLE